MSLQEKIQIATFEKRIYKEAGLAALGRVGGFLRPFCVPLPFY
jgi:hypothetical protein